MCNRGGMPTARFYTHHTLISTQLNERLASRTYVAVDQLSLADVVLYAATDAAVVCCVGRGV